ncbi:hypothetical protein CAPTEDRAFT_229172 [Capitella teleta]|uniref:DNA-directed RNA polymerase III subunit RPC9 n=1 Tax=Capitella teleta TaxID=283909 RepID=R7T610_CAPTE|nr:hypothetical protein CAPTEDRAFT_229172 [Capitella teleta]|eukprot:ELT88775.1 hypothetical protein CAPTEDRAFT_229172 [Capitella teleta]
MEVVQENAAMLSNYEVLSLLKDNKQSQTKGKRQQNTNVATILYSTLKYLEKTPCAAVQSPEKLADFMQAVDGFNLTKAEKLQLLNLRPATAVEIQLLIEESEERLSEEQIEQLLATVAEHLGSEEVTEEEGPHQSEMKALIGPTLNADAVHRGEGGNFYFSNKLASIF